MISGGKITVDDVRKFGKDIMRIPEGPVLEEYAKEGTKAVLSKTEAICNGYHSPSGYEPNPDTLEGCLDRYQSDIWNFKSISGLCTNPWIFLSGVTQKNVSLKTTCEALTAVYKNDPRADRMIQLTVPGKDDSGSDVVIGKARDAQDFLTIFARPYLKKLGLAPPPPPPPAPPASGAAAAPEKQGSASLEVRPDINDKDLGASVEASASWSSLQKVADRSWSLGGTAELELQSWADYASRAQSLPHLALERAFLPKNDADSTGTGVALYASGRLALGKETLQKFAEAPAKLGLDLGVLNRKHSNPGLGAKLSLNGAHEFTLSSTTVAGGVWAFAGFGRSNFIEPTKISLVEDGFAFAAGTEGSVTYAVESGVVRKGILSGGIYYTQAGSGARQGASDYVGWSAGVSSNFQLGPVPLEVSFKHDGRYQMPNNGNPTQLRLFFTPALKADLTDRLYFVGKYVGQLGVPGGGEFTDVTPRDNTLGDDATGNSPSDLNFVTRVGQVGHFVRAGLGWVFVKNAEGEPVLSTEVGASLVWLHSESGPIFGGAVGTELFSGALALVLKVNL